MVLAAWAGDSAISTVEVSSDGGKSYARCEAHLVYRAGADPTRVTAETGLTTRERRLVCMILAEGAGNSPKLDELRRMRQEFRGRDTESLYERWRESGDQVVRDFIASQPAVSGPLAGEFVPYRLEHDYGFLGLDR